MTDNRAAAEPLSERDIKRAVLDHLQRQGSLRDGVAINELPVADGRRRADLAVANGKLQAFEIKSDLDSLRRLDGQIAQFITRFDKVVVVTASRFLSSALQRLPTQVEIWEATRVHGEVRLRVVRRGSTRAITNKAILASYLRKSELISLVRAARVRCDPAMSRVELECMVAALPLKRLRAFVLARLKWRYRNPRATTSRARMQRAAPSAHAPATPRILARAHSDGRWPSRAQRFAAFERKYGSLPKEMPNAVATRRQPRR